MPVTALKKVYLLCNCHLSRAMAKIGGNVGIILVQPPYTTGYNIRFFCVQIAGQYCCLCKWNREKIPKIVAPPLMKYQSVFTQLTTVMSCQTLAEHNGITDRLRHPSTRPSPSYCRQTLCTDPDQSRANVAILHYSKLRVYEQVLISMVQYTDLLRGIAGIDKLFS